MTVSRAAYLILAVAAAVLLSPGALTGQEVEDLYGLGLEELSRLRVSSGGALTRTQIGRTPASVTLITRQMIRESGARNLNELLEIYVPNYMYLRQATTPLVFGLRGVISARNNKTLLLVNGRVMNQRMMLGAISEHFLPLLGDIESIEVVRGPGSSIYGSGAINGVIAIRTQDENPFSGIDLSLRKGWIEGFAGGEVRLGRTFGSDGHVFAYYGADSYEGAGGEHTPVVFSTNRDGVFTAGMAVDSALIHDHRALDGKPHHKAHVQARYGGSRIWARFVRGSMHYLPARIVIENRRGFEGSFRGLLYEQLTVQAEQRIGLHPRLSLDLRASYDVHDLARRFETVPADYEYTLAMREEELALRLLLSWTPSAAHSLAVGIERSREWFGRAATHLTDDPAHNGRTEYSPWRVTTLSYLGEYQWNPSPRWTVFLGGRADRHTFTEWMYSPKAAVIFGLDERNTTKLIYAGSVRKSDDLELKTMNERNPELPPEVEKMRSVELRHDLRLDDATVSVTGFRFKADLTGWLGGQARVAPLGQVTAGGVEVEAAHHGRSHDLTVSFSYTRLMDFELADSVITTQLETSQPYGYGDDLQNWPRHSAKVVWGWRFSRDFRALTLLRTFWDFQGAEDYAAYNNEVLKSRASSQTDGRTDAFSGHAYLDTGVSWNPGERLHLDLRLHNTLGWLQPRMNKRNFYGRLAGFRSEAAALSLRLGWTL
jgi:outer membrane receptor for ferrienterochelin and colicin